MIATTRWLVRKIATAPLSQLPEKIISGARHYWLGYPALVIVQTVSACNLRCRHCFINLYGSEIPDGAQRLMDFERFATIVSRIRKTIRQAQRFQFSTFEALLHPDIFRMMDLVLAVNPKIGFPLLTN
ncbi:MAG: hypothetical protein QME74_02790 [Candidatus Edwardsbacteria bacterium]|nr:hypothetical protein [Candidatus Edwardsbacteria bacterium]